MVIGLQQISSFKLSRNYNIDKKANKKNHLFGSVTMEEAFKIYNEIDNNSKDLIIINNSLRLCCLSKEPDKALKVWQDIKKYEKEKKHFNDFVTSHFLLLQCCIKSRKHNMDMYCIDILKYLVSKTRKMELKLHGNIINKLIKKCNNNLSSLQYIHSLIDNKYFIGDMDIIKTALINAYGDCSDCLDCFASISLFESINNSNDIITIGCMMKLFVKNLCYKQALQLYDKTNDNNNNNAITNVLALKACKGIGITYYDKGIQIIQESLIKYPFDMFIKTSIIDFYGTFDDMENCKKIFKSIPDNKKTIAIINCYLNVLIDHNENEYALEIYDKYALHLHNGITDLLTIKACKNSNNLEKGVKIHSQCGNIKKNIKLMNGLIDFYGHFGLICKAYLIFDSISDAMRDNVCISTMMNVCINNNECNDAVRIYKYNQYCNSNLIDSLCHLFAIKACSHGHCGDYKTGHDIIQSINNNNNNNNIDLVNTIIHFYGSFNEIKKAHECFKAIANNFKNVQTITVMMEAFCKSDCNIECIQLFNNINRDYAQFNSRFSENVWCNIAIKACTHGTMLYVGQEIHSNITELHAYDIDKSVQINLINMYAKCGRLDIAENIFNDIDINNKDVEIYNAMIHGYGRNGQLTKAMKLFENKLFEPDRKTFILIINACSHCGDYEQAKYIWDVLICDEDIKKDIYVMTAFIDCISRKGHLKEAKQIIINNNLNEEVAWTALLSGCTKHNNQMTTQVLDEMNQRFRANVT